MLPMQNFLSQSKLQLHLMEDMQSHIEKGSIQGNVLSIINVTYVPLTTVCDLAIRWQANCPLLLYKLEPAGKS